MTNKPGSPEKITKSDDSANTGEIEVEFRPLGGVDDDEYHTVSFCGDI